MPNLLDILVITCPESLFPRSVRDLLAFGVDRSSVLDLCRAFGGRRIYIAESPGKLGEIIGDDAADIIIQRFHGEFLDIPSLSRLRAAARAHEIRAARETGQTIADLAREFDLSMRRVRKILNSHPNTEHSDHEPTN